MKNCNEVFKQYKENEYENHTRRTAYSRCCYINKFFLKNHGEQDSDLITSKDIDNIFTKMKKDGFAHNSIYGCYSAIRSFYKFIIDNGLGVNDPISKVFLVRKKAK